ncbi:hypothetical protein V1514DRAFT_329589 [Lipomyces japonicus]|uniref:uncharacterized protein n=1 Tax=Lipomyces japonicus TaxID=56871 RepID=UPI0034CE1CEB
MSSAAAPPAGPPPPSVPEGWLAKYDLNYKTFYYVNLATGNSQWEKPSAGNGGAADAPPAYSPTADSARTEKPSQNGVPQQQQAAAHTQRNYGPQGGYQQQQYTPYQGYGGYQQQPYAPYPQQQPYGGYPPQQAYYQQQPQYVQQQQQQRRSGLGTGTGIALGAAGGLVGGMLLADAMHDNYNEGYVDGAQDFGGGGGDFGGGDFGGGDF